MGICGVRHVNISNINSNYNEKINYNFPACFGNYSNSAD